MPQPHFDFLILPLFFQTFRVLGLGINDPLGVTAMLLVKRWHLVDDGLALVMRHLGGG